MICSINDNPILNGRVEFPLNGGWVGDFECQSVSNLSLGQVVTLSMGTVTYTGHVISFGVFASKLQVRIGGGTVPLTDNLPPISKYKTTISQLVSDFGYVLETPNAKQVLHWTRPSGTRAEALESLSAEFDWNWRFMPDGRVWMRAEAQEDRPASDFGFVELERENDRGLVIGAVETPSIQPGMAIGSDVIGDVMYEISDNFRVRYFTNSKSLRSLSESLIRFVTRDSMFLGTYLCNIESVNPSGQTVDLFPFDRRIAGRGLQSIPLFHGIPGVRSTPRKGGMCLLGYRDGRPSQPYVLAFPSGDNVDSVQVGGNTTLALGPNTDARLVFIDQCLAQLVANIGVIASNPSALTGTSLAAALTGFVTTYNTGRTNTRIWPLSILSTVLRTR